MTPTGCTNSRPRSVTCLANLLNDSMLFSPRLVLILSNALRYTRCNLSAFTSASVAQWIIGFICGIYFSIILIGERNHFLNV